MAAYAAALEEIYTNHTFPDGKDFGFDGFHDMSENKFAVYDIDSDGKKELIVLYTTTYTVSYTHLDVYKRQACTTRRFPGCAALP